MPRRIRLGDVIEFKTQRGLAYAQYINSKSSMGPLIRVIEGFWKTRPDNISKIANSPTQFYIFFDVGYAINKKYVAFVANIEIPEREREFPILKDAFRDLDGKVTQWWLVQGDKEWKISRLSPEQKKLSWAQATNDVTIIEMLENGYRPEDDN